MYRTDGTIISTLKDIENNNLILPAIQREFVWDVGQICRLFDSLMQGYPFGTFLYWIVTPENSRKFQIYDFILEFHERDNRHCPRLNLIQERQLTAVLDGQQRLTALNIGLRGSITLKLPKKRWNNPNAFPERRLYLDLLWNPDDDSDGQKYRFEFCTQYRFNHSNNNECLFPVRDILDIEDGPSMVKWLNENLPQHQVDQAYKVLDRLYRVIYNENIIAFYEEKSQDLEKVLQIFIRTNSGGTILSYSDLLLSIAVAQWRTLDARKVIHELVDDLNAIGDKFQFSKDFVLKGGLMLSEIHSVGFKVENFNRENMLCLEENWDRVKTALTIAVKLVSSFGFNAQNLRADSPVLVIAYYIFNRGLNDAYIDNTASNEDRKIVHQWLIRSILKTSGIWGSGLDTLLTLLRKTIKNNDGAFPYRQILDRMVSRGKSLKFENEEIETLVELPYKDKRIFSLLSLMFPFIDLKNNHFHIDHVYPSSLFTKNNLRESGVPESKLDQYRELYNNLPNLQLLNGKENLVKGKKLPHQWFAESMPDENSIQDYKNRHLLNHLPETITQFDNFYEERRIQMIETVRVLLADDF